jgi:hypothetical protein
MPPLLTCFSCEKEIGQVEEGKDEHNMIANIMTRSQVDDETKIARIPIAGEHDSDYDTDSNDEIEEEEDSDLLQNNVPVESPAVTGESSEAHFDTTEDESLPIVTILNPINVITTNDRSQETDNENNDNKVDKTDTAWLAPVKRQSDPIYELTREATKTKFKLFTFDDSAAYLTDEIAFLIGPTKDGVIKEHQLSPIPLHDNPFAPLFNDKDNEVTFCVDDIQISITDDKKKKKFNKRKKTKKINNRPRRLTLTAMTLTSQTKASLSPCSTSGENK